MQNLKITWQTIAAIFAGLGVLLGGIKAVASLFEPYRKLKRSVAEHERLLASDHERLNREEASTKAMMGGILALMNHEITGNSIEGLKRARDELQTHLVQK